ncbi:MAG: energy-coupling factor transporter ATPase [Negativicutes bacterium]|nr:energy-coupling factor transporter ATPase [Negativicutes bacterium]
MSIKLTNVSYTYMPGTPYERHALKNINLEIQRGEFVGIIGHTGSGKSTLVQHLNGLIKPTAGTVTVDGADLNAKGPEAKQARLKVGMVFQYPEHQLFEETIAADIAFGPKNLSLSADEIDRRVRQAMKFAGLDYDTYAGRSPFQLSGGQMRRVAIAGVVALEPDYLILDEPSAGLDPRGRDEIFGEIRELHKRTGTTVVLVTHNMEEVARLATRLIVMKRGEAILDGRPLDIFRASRAALLAAGVDVPLVTSLLGELKAHGLDVDETVLTPDKAAETIFDAARRRASC